MIRAVDNWVMINGLRWTQAVPQSIVASGLYRSQQEFAWTTAHRCARSGRNLPSRAKRIST